MYYIKQNDYANMFAKNYYIIISSYCLLSTPNYCSEIRKVIVPFKSNEKNITNFLINDVRFIPYLVSVHQCNEPSLCGGSIIGDKHVLTAGHCIQQNEFCSNNFFVRVGSSQHAKGGQEIKIAKVIMHPFYGKAGPFDHDIALLKLEDTIPHTILSTKIDLPFGSFKMETGTKLNVYGWGSKSPHGKPSNTFEIKEVYVSDFADCVKIYNKIPPEAVTENMFCAYNPRANVCTSDSGGPVVHNGKLVGIVSWGKDCDDKTYPGVYTKLSFFDNWIRENMDN